MRPAILAGLVSLALPASGFAQAGPYVAVVTDVGTRLRAGPSDQFPETATLPRGFQLLVDHEEPNGWLAVQDVPGRMNSVSWVQTQFVNFDKNSPIPQLVEVDEAGTTLRAGQIGLAQPLHIQRAKVPGGTILTVIGKGVEFEGKTWYPVVPPVGDFRYVPKQAVKFEKPANTAVTVKENAPLPQPDPASGSGSGSVGSPAMPTASLPGPGSNHGGMLLPPGMGSGASISSASGKPPVQDPLWAQAEAAEREGRLDDAEKLYFELARRMNQPGGDHDIANLCYTRIHGIREKKRGGGSGSGFGQLPGPVTPPVRSTTGSVEKPSGQLPPPEPREDRGRWSQPGKLVRSALSLDGRRTYALESSPGIPIVYVVAGQGVDLEKFVNKRVEVFGVSNTRRDLSRPFVVATAVEGVQ
jgi:hypothetical protein